MIQKCDIHQYTPRTHTPLSHVTARSPVHRACSLLIGGTAHEFISLAGRLWPLKYVLKTLMSCTRIQSNTVMSHGVDLAALDALHAAGQFDQV